MFWSWCIRGHTYVTMLELLRSSKVVLRQSACNNKSTLLLQLEKIGFWQKIQSQLKNTWGSTLRIIYHSISFHTCWLVGMFEVKLFDYLPLLSLIEATSTLQFNCTCSSQPLDLSNKWHSSQYGTLKSSRRKEETFLCYRSMATHLDYSDLKIASTISFYSYISPIIQISSCWYQSLLWIITVGIRNVWEIWFA